MMFQATCLYMHYPIIPLSGRSFEGESQAHPIPSEQIHPKCIPYRETHGCMVQALSTYSSKRAWQGERRRVTQEFPFYKICNKTRLAQSMKKSIPKDLLRLSNIGSYPLRAFSYTRRPCSTTLGPTFPLLNHIDAQKGIFPIVTRQSRSLA